MTPTFSKDTKCTVYSKSQAKDIEVTIRRFDDTKGKYFVQRADGRYLWYAPDALKFVEAAPTKAKASKSRSKKQAPAMDALVAEINAGALDRDQIQNTISDL